MRTATGTQLNGTDRAHVLGAYCYRFTGEHFPAWAQKPMPNGSAYKVQFADDADWLANTRFAVTKTGRLDRRFNHCESSPTWPS